MKTRNVFKENQKKKKQLSKKYVKQFRTHIFYQAKLGYNCVDLMKTNILLIWTPDDNFFFWVQTFL